MRKIQPCATINTAAEAVMRNMLNLNDVLSHQRETLSRETQRRSEQDAGILKQVDSLAEANMWRLVNEHDSRLAISEAMQQIKELPSRSATDDEFNEMLDSLYNQ